MKGDLLPNGYVSITEGLYPDETVANSGSASYRWNENKENNNNTEIKQS